MKNEKDLGQLIKETIEHQFKTVQIKPHLTRKETAGFFDVSVNCINNWVNNGILSAYKVGQRTYFRKSELIEVMFNNQKIA